MSAKSFRRITFRLVVGAGAILGSHVLSAFGTFNTFALALVGFGSRDSREPGRDGADDVIPLAWIVLNSRRYCLNASSSDGRTYSVRSQDFISATSQAPA